ncbi:aspartate-semialdehyde dehydrogenase [Candidatus Uhrbacteria bacterium]|nr:aspartate-semialdehyde dehydrogenase [Candidatus Uhrbacteria bacterium]
MSSNTKKIPVAILGATGMVGQQYVALLANHPWFEVAVVAASTRSAGLRYGDAVLSRWYPEIPFPDSLKDYLLADALDIKSIAPRVKLVFSALELPNKEELQELENAYAQAGVAVVSNASAHRWTNDVPMIIPEINHHHADIIPAQRQQRGWNGLVAVKPNCSIQSYLTPLFALMQAGYDISHVAVTTLQAVSGAGYPGVPSLDIIDNIIPYIGGEEEKTEQEPLKILGDIRDGRFFQREGLTISAHCNRVPVRDGHTACVSVKFAGAKPELARIIDIWNAFRSAPQELGLPSAPTQPIVYLDETNRPQPKKDRMRQQGMAINVGRLRACPVFDIKFVGLSHNTLRGAAGGGILNAELLVSKGYIK